MGKYRWATPPQQQTEQVVEEQQYVAPIPEKYSGSAASHEAAQAVIEKVFVGVKDPTVIQEAIERAQLSPSFKPETMEACFRAFRDKVLSERAGQ